MTIWVIISWVLVAVLTAVNIVVFVQLKKASDQMMKMVFPGAKNMNEALSQMQRMGGALGGMGRGGMGGGANMEGQLKAAMDMLQNMTKNQKR